MKKHKDERLVAAYLCLAANKQKFSAIEKYVSFLAENDFNALYLYLEGWVRTKSFSCQKKEYSYSPDEMRRLDAIGAKYGIQVIPALELFGHSQGFFCHDDLVKYSSYPDQQFHGDFCPSNAEGVKFLLRYLKEVSELFTSKFVCVGGDEVIPCRCKKCLKRMADGESEGHIYALHVKALCDEVVKLGKTPVFYDDMFEKFPQELSVLPNAAQGTSWEYDLVVEGKRCKTSRRRSWDVGDFYRARGMKYQAGAVDWYLSNVFSFAKQCGNDENLAGFVLTQWTAPLYRKYPVVAYAGRLWKSLDLEREREIFNSVIEDIFGIDDPALASAFRCACSPWENYGAAVKPFNETGKDFDFSCGIRKCSETADFLELDHVTASRDTLLLYQGKVRRFPANRILDDTIVFLNSRIMALSFMRWTNLCVNAKIKGQALPSSKTIEAMIKSVNDGFQHQIDDYTRPDDLNYAEQDDVPQVKREDAERKTNVAERLKNLSAFVKMFRKTENFIELRLRVDDEWTRGNVKVFLDGKKVFDNFPSAVTAGDRTLLTYYVPVDKVGDSAEIEITLGSRAAVVGVQYVKIHRARRAPLLPSAVVEEKNYVMNGRALLLDDNSFCIMGSPSGAESVRFDDANAVKLAMKERSSIIGPY